MSQAGPGNDINAGSPGSQKAAPTQIPASLVQPLARALWRRLPHQDPDSSSPPGLVTCPVDPVSIAEHIAR